MRTLYLVIVACALVACRPGGPDAQAQEATSQPSTDVHVGQPEAPPPAPGHEIAIFAGGCFWCMEGPFERIDGVTAVLSGYTGGDEPNPTYHQVGSGSTGHTEAVRVEYDPAVVSFETLLDTYWRSMDPTDAGGQFADRGTQYRPAIFAVDDAQRAAAEASRAALEASGVFDAPIIVPVDDAGTFWVAEDYHQDYYLTNTAHYNAYRRGSGRAGFLERVWGADDH